MPVCGLAGPPGDIQLIALIVEVIALDSGQDFTGAPLVALLLWPCAPENR